MKSVTKFVMLGLLLIPLAASINMGSASAKEVTVDQAFGASNVTNDKFFVPPEVTVNVGDTVVWKNMDSATHTVTSGTVDDPDRWGEIFDSGLGKPGSEFKHTFDEVGEYPYLCQLHPWMEGKVIVVEGMEMPEPGGPTIPTIVIPTDNSSVNVEVTIDKGMVKDKEIMVDPPQQVKFDLKFLDPTTGKPLQHVNYQFHVADKSGAMVAHKMGLHVHEGMDSQSVAFSDTGSFTLMVVIEGTGINKPYDTAHSGTASSLVTVTPEFPFSVIAIMAAVVGMGVLATRIKSPLKL
jgi:plastocyanin